MARRYARTIDFKQWDLIPAIVLEETGVATNLGGGLGFLAPQTILRCRGEVSIQFDETAQAGDRAAITFGLGIVSSDAFAAGAGSVPDPGGEPEYPWLWWGSIEIEAIIAASAWTGGYGWGPSAGRLEVDTKAMRKVKPGETLCWVAQTTLATGAPTMIIKLNQTRVLVGT